MPKTCARGRSDRAGGDGAMGATFSSWRRRRPSEGDGGFETLNPRDAAMALDEDTRLFHRALRKHDRRLDKRARAARRTLAWARGDPNAPAPSSPTLRARGPSVASVGKRGGGLGEFGLDRRPGPNGSATDDAVPGAVPGDARGGPGGGRRGPAREYDIIRAECAKKMELAERNRARARRAASRRQAGDDPSWRTSGRADAREESGRAEARAREKEAPFSDTSGKEEPGGRASSSPAAPVGYRTADFPISENLRRPAASQGTPPPPPSPPPPPPPPPPPSIADRRLRAGYEQVKVFRDGNSLFHCARLGEIVCQARERGASAGGAGADDGIRNDPLLAGRGDSVAAVLRRGIRSLGRAQAAATAAALRRGAMDRVLAVEEDEADEEGGKPGSSCLDRPSSSSDHRSSSSSLAAEMSTKAVDDAIVTAVRGAELLDESFHQSSDRQSTSGGRGAPIDNWRRAMVHVGEIARAEATSGAYGERDEDLYNAAVRRAYCDAMSRSNVPATYLELAALSAHLRRPITVIRGPVGAGDEEKRSLGETAVSGERMYRARCVSEVVGERYAAIGRRGFTLFWELAEGVPTGLPAGDFVLLVPRVGDGDRYDDRYGAVGDGAGGTMTRTGRDRPRKGRRSPLSPGLSRAAPAQEEERAPPLRRIDQASALAAAELGMLAAASDGNKTAVYRHVSRGGVSLGAADRVGDTALHRAARGGCVGLIKTVLKAAGRGDPRQPSRRELMDATNAAGRTPLQVAVDAKRVKTARYLRREGSADPRGELDALQGAPFGDGYASSSGYSSSAVSDTGSSDAGSDVASDVASDLASDSDSELERGGPRGGLEGRARGRRTKGTGGSQTWAGHGAPATYDYSAYGRLGTSEYATSDATSDGGGVSSDDGGFRACGGWSDVPTPSGSEVESDAGSLWNSESESEWGGSRSDATSDATSEGELDEGHGDRARYPSFLR